MLMENKSAHKLRGKRSFGVQRPIIHKGKRKMTYEDELTEISARKNARKKQIIDHLHLHHPKLTMIYMILCNHLLIVSYKQKKHLFA